MPVFSRFNNWASLRAFGISLSAAAVVASDVSAMGYQPVAQIVQSFQRNLQFPEALLIKSLLGISENRLGDAFSDIDQLLQANPNFRLAQLIKGDLLLARVRPLSTLGNAERAPERIDELREEARARLQRYRLEAPTELLPKYLLQLQAEQKHALVVDTAKSTLYVFENRDGQLRYAADYYVSVGKNGINKFKEGDKKTPLGVYHVTRQLPRKKLAELYGTGAFPLNYPNEWDARQGRRGHGIWLHGTPRDTYSRPPRASDGCVVLTNLDLDELAKRLQIGLTPVVITEGIEWVRPGALHAQRDSLARDVERWRQDWESRNVENYLQHYASGFSSGKFDLERWSEQKRRVGSSKEWIKLSLNDVSMFLYPGSDELAVVTFFQDYSSNNLMDRIRKRQYWIREGERWKILYEGQA